MKIQYLICSSILAIAGTSYGMNPPISPEEIEEVAIKLAAATKEKHHEEVWLILKNDKPLELAVARSLVPLVGLLLQHKAEVPVALLVSAIHQRYSPSEKDKRYENSRIVELLAGNCPDFSAKFKEPVYTKSGNKEIDGNPHLTPRQLIDAYNLEEWTRPYNENTSLYSK